VLFRESGILDLNFKIPEMEQLAFTKAWISESGQRSGI